MQEVDGRRFLEIASTLTTQRNEKELMIGVLKELMAVCHCEKGVLFLWQNDRLISRATLREDGVDMPYTPWLDDWSARAAAENKIQAVDISQQLKWDVGIRSEDMENGMQTKSLLAVPMLSPANQLLGVIRLSNAKNQNGEVVPFSKDLQEMALAVAGLSAVSLENQHYIEEIRALLASIVRVISAAIDERTPFNANHTRNMAKYGWRLIAYCNEQYETGNCDIYFSQNRRQQFMMSIWLHDMGKMVIPNHIMNKDSRLGARIKDVRCRFERILLLYETQYLNKELSESQYLQCTAVLQNAKELVFRLNDETVLNDVDKQALEEISRRTYMEKDGSVHPWLLSEEIDCLQIQKGTLTDEERQIMEGHVVFTEKLLGEIVFSKEYSQVPQWAAAHHEYLDGSGYPKGLKGDEIPLEVRLLTILDIFDALTASDRPYKKPAPLPMALDTLENMAEQGKLDARLVTLFIQSKCWENSLLPLL